jgi:hypothetical protein
VDNRHDVERHLVGKASREEIGRVRPDLRPDQLHGRGEDSVVNSADQY